MAGPSLVKNGPTKARSTTRQGAASYCTPYSRHTYSKGLPKWATDRGWQSAFPAVAEHIIPAKGYTFIENELQIPIHAVRNSLPLFRHLKKTFQNGDWSLVPTGTDDMDKMWFRVYVSKPLWSTNVSYMTACGQWEGYVKVQLGPAGRRRNLKFGMLHEKRDYDVDFQIAVHARSFPQSAYGMAEASRRPTKP